MDDKKNSRNYFKEIENKCQYAFVGNCNSVASSMHWKSGILPMKYRRYIGMIPILHVKNDT